MPNVGPTDPEDHIFGDVRGMVGYPFEVTRHDQGIKRLAGERRIVLHDPGKRLEGFAIDCIDDVVALKDLLRQFGILLYESLQ